MAGRASLYLYSEADRRKAMAWCRNAPRGTKVDWREEPQRTTAQNSRLWPLLERFAEQRDWPANSGKMRTKEWWKTFFMSSLNLEIEAVPSIDLDDVVTLGHSTSNLSKSEFTQLMELIEYAAAKWEVDLSPASVLEEKV